MQEDIIRIVIVLVFSGLCYGINAALNPVAKVKEILGYIIIAVCILFLVGPVVDVISQALNSVHGR